MSVRSPSRLASLTGRSLARAFEQHREAFLEITRRASKRFEDGDFAGLRADMVERIDLYRASVDAAEETVVEQLKERVSDRSLWQSMKAVFSALIAERDDWEIAETFFNSVTRRIFATHGVDPLVEFVDSDFT
ncbi:MAG: isocitrate dehydrogenase kinase/phosphatase AceK regulatory subunit, partial [Myxococcota bacterium]